MTEMNEKALRLAEREWAPSYVCTKCAYCGPDKPTHDAQCGYEMKDINAELRAMATLIRAQQEEIGRLRDWIIEGHDGEFCAHECGTFLLDDDDYESVRFDDDETGLLCRPCFNGAMDSGDARAALTEEG